MILFLELHYLSKLLGILGSSINQATHALVPAPAANEPIQFNKLANIFYLLTKYLFHINYNKHHSFYSCCMATETSYILKDGSLNLHQIVQNINKN